MLHYVTVGELIAYSSSERNVYRKDMSKVSRGNSENRVILNTSRTMLCYFRSINSCTLVLHLQVGLEGN